VAGAVAEELPAIAAVVERVVAALDRGGRLIYAGAGTSGRLGMLDAAECPPTYGIDPSRVQGLLAGGPMAMTTSVEAAEDDEAQGAREVDALGVGADDVVVGIAASGRTPYVVGALRRARSRGACAVALVGNRDGPVAAVAELVIAPRTGPEVVTGSTRMKAGTATKLVLNTITTGAMIRIGKTYGNLMVDLRATNLKLTDRSERIVMEVCGGDREQARATLNAADGRVKTAIVMRLLGVDRAEAERRLDAAGGVIRRVVPNPPPPVADA
jgi:N-acetylmuramic acid 6-phosphate etherase